MTRTPNPESRIPTSRSTVWMLLALVMVLTASLRWVRFTEFPPGLWYDEAYSLVEGQRLAQGGDFYATFAEKHGGPAIIWLTALALKLGADHLAPRWVTSTSGVLGVLLLFFAVRDIMRDVAHEEGQGCAVLTSSRHKTLTATVSGAAHATKHRLWSNFLPQAAPGDGGYEPKRTRCVAHEEGKQADWLALGSAAILGTNYEHLFHTRMSWHPALITTTFIVTVWFFWRGIRDGRYRDFVVAGIMAGASQYDGVASRLLPLILLLVLIGRFGKDRQCWRTHWKGLLVAVGVALLVDTLLISAFLSRPDWFAGKSHSAVPPSDLSSDFARILVGWLWTGRSRLAAPLSDLPSNLGRTLAGWLWIGGAALHDLPGRPIYDPAMGSLLLVGVAIAIWKIRRPAYNVWLAWFVGSLPGGILSNPTPMFYRIMTAVPATAALCAIGGWHVWQFTVKRFPRLRHLVLLLLLGILAVSTWFTCYDYFVRWANWPHLPAVMDVGKWRAAEIILEAPADEITLVTAPDGLERTITYALHAHTDSPVRAFDGAHCLVYPTQADAPIHYLAILGYEHRSLARLQALFPSGYQTVDSVFEQGAPYFVNFFVPTGTEMPILGNLSSSISYQDILLHGVYTPKTTIVAGQAFSVTLTWEPLRPITDSYTVFVHLLDGRPEAAEAPLKTQHDGIPCDATEPTWRWQPGEYILDEHILAIPPELPASKYLLGVGLYNSNTLERLIPTGKDLYIRWNEAIVRTITVTNGQ